MCGQQVGTLIVAVPNVIVPVQLHIRFQWHSKAIRPFVTFLSYF
jgi:hypothetical protein